MPIHWLLGAVAWLIFSSCQFSPFPFPWDRDSSDKNNHVNINGSPSEGAQDIYASADLSRLCTDARLCEPGYGKLPASFIHTAGQEPLDAEVCNFDYNPNMSSSFVLRRIDGTVNGLNLLLSKEDLFFIAWVSTRYQINPYFLLGILSQESAANCAAVSVFNGEGCFQITNTFGQGQLNDSYPERVAEWFWSTRSDSYYPDDIFVAPSSYFGEVPTSEQFRLTLDPTVPVINGVEISSITNFHFGIIASSLYFHWQPYLLYYTYSEATNAASQLFQDDNGKSLWQAAAYNGGAFGASRAIRRSGRDFLGEMTAETQDYAPAVIDYCTTYQHGESTYDTTYAQDDISWIIDLLAMTYPNSGTINWDEVKKDVTDVFFPEGTEELNFTDDIKAVIYVISTHAPALAPEWPDENSI